MFSTSSMTEIPRQRFSLSLVLCAGEILPRAKPTETSMFLDLGLEIRYRGLAPNRITRPGLFTR